MKRSITALFAGAAVFAVTAGPALAATSTTASFTSAAAGRPDVVDLAGGGAPSAPAGSYNFSIESQTITAFCIEAADSLPDPADGVSYTVSIPSATAAGEIAAIAAGHGSIGTALGDANDEAAAAQLAIWTFSDALVLDAAHVPDSALRARAQEIVDGVSAATLPSFTGGDVAVTGTGDGTNATATATVTDQDGNPLADQDVVFTPAVGDPQTVTTGADGTASATFPATDTLNVAVSWTGSVAAGAVLTPADGSQLLVTAQSYTVTRTAETDITTDGTVTTDPTVTDPTVTDPSVPTTDTDGGTLAHTGSGLGWVIALLTSAGIVAAVFAVRRSRTW